MTRRVWLVAAQVWVKAGHEDDFLTDERIGNVVLSLLDRPDIGAVLWRTGPTAAAVICHDPKTGELGYSHSVHTEDPDGSTLGPAAERLARAAGLLGKR